MQFDQMKYYVIDFVKILDTKFRNSNNSIDDKKKKEKKDLSITAIVLNKKRKLLDNNI